MSVTTEEIRNKVFPVAAKDGYYKKNVDSFLREIADALEQVTGEKEALEELLTENEAKLQKVTRTSREEIARLTAENEELQSSMVNTDVESEAIAQALIAAQRTGIEIERAAREAADQTRVNAENLAAEIVGTAEAERDEINHQTAEIILQREKERANLIEFLERTAARSMSIADEYRTPIVPTDAVLHYVDSDLAAMLGWEVEVTDVAETDDVEDIEGIADDTDEVVDGVADATDGGGGTYEYGECSL